MNARKPSRRELAEDAVPIVSITNDVVRVEFGSARFDMSLFAACALRAKLADKLAAMAKLRK